MTSWCAVYQAAKLPEPDLRRMTINWCKAMVTIRQAQASDEAGLSPTQTAESGVSAAQAKVAGET